MRCEPDVGQQFVGLIRGMGWQATEKVREGGDGINGAILAGAFHWPDMDTERKLSCARRSEHTNGTSLRRNNLL